MSGIYAFGDGDEGGYRRRRRVGTRRGRVGRPRKVGRPKSRTVKRRKYKKSRVTRRARGDGGSFYGYEGGARRRVRKTLRRRKPAKRAPARRRVGLSKASLKRKLISAIKRL